MPKGNGRYIGLPRAVAALSAMAAGSTAMAGDESLAAVPPGYSISRTASRHDFDYFAGGWTTHHGFAPGRRIGRPSSCAPTLPARAMKADPDVSRVAQRRPAQGSRLSAAIFA